MDPDYVRVMMFVSSMVAGSPRVGRVRHPMTAGAFARDGVW
jgi:hypothetical protein